MSQRATSSAKNSSPVARSPRRTRSQSMADAKSDIASCSSEKFNPRNLVTNTTSGIGDSVQQSGSFIAIGHSQYSRSGQTLFPVNRLVRERICSSEPLPPPNNAIATSSGSCSLAQDDSSEEPNPRNQLTRGAESYNARIRRIKKGKAPMQQIDENEILEEVKYHVDEDLSSEDGSSVWNQLLRKAKKYRRRKEKLEEILQNKELDAKKKNDDKDKVADDKKELDRLSTQKNEMQDDAGNAAENKEKGPDTVSTQKKTSGDEKITEKMHCCWK